MNSRRVARELLKRILYKLEICFYAVFGIDSGVSMHYLNGEGEGKQYN